MEPKRIGILALIEDSKDGTYNFDYNCIPGDNEVTVSAKGKTAHGFPLQFRRKTDQEIVEELEQRELEARMAEELRLQEEEEERKRLEEEQKRSGKSKYAFIFSRTFFKIFH